MDDIEHLDFEPGEPDDELSSDPDALPTAAPNTAEGMNSVVPLGWKPTPSEPVPVVRCSAIKKDGTRCKRWSLRGYHRCRTHAGPGALMPDGNVNKYRAAVTEAARLRLIDSTDMALDVIEALTQPGTGEAIRLKAAESILDRAGVRGGFELDVSGEVTVSPVDEIRKRLAELKKGGDELRKMQGDIIDGEVVEDDEDQPSLFDLPEDDEA